jgi:Phosphoenolpyruvate phosphomutase
MRPPRQLLLWIGIASLSDVILNSVNSLTTDNFSKLKFCSSATKLGVSRNDYVTPQDRVKALRRLLESDELTIMPCCYDGLTARLVEQAGFDLTFMTGFGVSSTYGLPDTGKILSIFQLFVSRALTLLST